MSLHPCRRSKYIQEYNKQPVYLDETWHLRQWELIYTMVFYHRLYLVSL